MRIEPEGSLRMRAAEMVRALEVDRYVDETQARSITVRVAAPVAAMVDALVEEGYYKDRTAAVNEFLRRSVHEFVVGVQEASAGAGERLVRKADETLGIGTPRWGGLGWWELHLKSQEEIDEIARKLNAGVRP